ncbi:hypothetical protein L6452_42690 [Arctium lappa]|uniref:Uncharacterized protein n=1 Tax=Arctium lappa TaxID=4217 RepID=A0ACB8XIY6_ARCLA|nr:hypothetical protein L6452_42690 [Arctium lappa]
MDMDGFQTITRKSSQKAHASSSKGQQENQKKDKDNQSSLESGKLSTENLKSKSKVPSHKEYRSVQKKNTPQDPGSSSLSSLIYVAYSKPMDAFFEHDELIDEMDVIEVESDDGDTARFLTNDPMPSQDNPVSTPEPERMDSTPSHVSR